MPRVLTPATLIFLALAMTLCAYSPLNRAEMHDTDPPLLHGMPSCCWVAPTLQNGTHSPTDSACIQPPTDC